MLKKLRTRLASALSAVIIPVTLVCSSVPALAAGTAGNPVTDTAAAESSESAVPSTEAAKSSPALPEGTRELEEKAEAPVIEAPAEENVPEVVNKDDEAPAEGTPVCTVTTGAQSRSVGADVTFDTLEEAFASIEEGQTATITLTGNAVVKGSIEVNGNVTLTADGDYSVSCANEGNLFFLVNKNQTLTVEGQGNNIVLENGIILTDLDSVLNLNAGTTLTNASLLITGQLKMTDATVSDSEATYYEIIASSDAKVSIENSAVNAYIKNASPELRVKASSVKGIVNVKDVNNDDAMTTLSGKCSVGYVVPYKNPVQVAADYDGDGPTRVYVDYLLNVQQETKHYVPVDFAKAETGSLNEAMASKFYYSVMNSAGFTGRYEPYLVDGKLQTATLTTTTTEVTIENPEYTYTGKDPQAEGGLGKVTTTVKDGDGKVITPSEGKLATYYEMTAGATSTPPTHPGDYKIFMSYAGEENRAAQTVALGSSGSQAFTIKKAALKGSFVNFWDEISVSQGSVTADFKPAEDIDAAQLKLNYTWTLTDKDGTTTATGDTLKLTKADIGKTVQVTVEDTSGIYEGTITSETFTVGKVATSVRIDGLSYDSGANYFESNDALQALLTKDNAVIVTYLDPEGHKNIAYDKDEISLKYDSVDDGMLLDRAPTEPGTYSLNVAFTPNDAHQAQDLQATSVSYTYTLMMPTTTEIKASALKGSYDVSDIQSLDKDLKKATTVRDKDGKAIKLDPNSGLLSFEAYTDAEGKNIAQTPAAGTYYVRAFYNRDGQEKAHIASSSELVKITLTQKAGPDSGTTADTTTGTTPGNPATGTPYSAGLSLVLLAALAGGSVLVLKKRS